jgi:hypothetical protein
LIALAYFTITKFPLQFNFIKDLQIRMETLNKQNSKHVPYTLNVLGSSAK